jgi:hypothetical protein
MSCSVWDPKKRDKKESEIMTQKTKKWIEPSCCHRECEGLLEYSISRLMEKS